MNIDLSTDAPPSPERTLQLAETFAELVRVMNHATTDHGALGSPADADRVLREIETAAMRLPQLLGQVGRWIAAEADTGRIAVPSGDWQGNLGGAVTALTIRLNTARADAEALHAGLKRAAHVTSDLVAREDGDG